MSESSDVTQAEPRSFAGYDVEEVLGVGGMGRVYRARERASGRTVALKVLSHEAAASPDAVKRFVREAQAAATLQHPNIVNVLDGGLDEASRRPFIVYELIDGGDLADVLERETVLTERETLRIGRDVCRALCRAHPEGIVHRDIKPANIMLTRDGTAKLADLGIAKSRHESSITATGMVMGTVDYLAPEQALGEPVDFRADLYALGLVLFRTATGRLAFPSLETTAATMTARTIDDCPDPRRHAPHLSDRFATIVARLTARDPERRPDSPRAALEMIEARLREIEPAEEKRRLGCGALGGLAAILGLGGLGGGLVARVVALAADG